MKSFLASLVALPLCVVLATGCAADVGEDDLEQASADQTSAVDETTATEDALTTTVANGSTARTTANLRLREGPSTNSGTRTVLPQGTSVTILDGTPDNGFYYVRARGSEGYCHGNYLALGSASQGNQGASGGTAGQASGQAFTSRGTGYYPSSSQLEGGFVDRRGAKLRTLQQYLAGNAEYVSVAMDSNAFAYGQKLRIRELEVKYNRVIEFRVVDTGGAFRGKGRSRIDICTANQSASLDSTINGTLHINIQ